MTDFQKSFLPHDQADLLYPVKLPPPTEVYSSIPGSLPPSRFSSDLVWRSDQPCLLLHTLQIASLRGKSAGDAPIRMSEILVQGFLWQTWLPRDTL